MMTKNVTGVTGVTGCFFEPVTSTSRSIHGFARFVTGVTGNAYVTRVGNVRRSSIKASPARIYTCHICHTCHIVRMARPADVTGTFFARAISVTPVTFKKIIGIIVNRIVCGPENIREFNARLRAELPDFHAFAKILHQTGLIDGLSGATLEDAPYAMAEPHAAHSGAESGKTCQACRQFQADNVGRGDGIGACRVDGWPNRLKWPALEACRQFEAAQ